MNPFPRRPLLVAAAALVGAVSMAALLGPARAEGESCTAHVAGVDTSKGAAPELVVSNLSNAELTLDLRVADADGATLIDRPGEIVVPASATRAIDVIGQLRRDLTRREKHYAGIAAVEVTGAAPFGPDTSVVHVTQYYGTRKRPRAGFVLRSLYRTNP